MQIENGPLTPSPRTKKRWIMMNVIEVQKALGSLKDFEIVTAFSVGGLEWIAFSKENKGKLLVISSQKTTVVDCDNGQIKECSADYDEEEL